MAQTRDFKKILISATSVAFLSILASVFLGEVSMAYATSDASIDSVMAMGKTTGANYKNSKTALEIAQLIYDAPTKSSVKKSSKTWQSAAYFPTVDAMLNAYFFKNFLEQINVGIQNLDQGNFDSPIDPEFVTPTTFTLMGCDPCPGHPEPMTLDQSFQAAPSESGSVNPEGSGSGGQAGNNSRSAS